MTVSDEEFERNVEAAVSAIAEQNREAESLELKKTGRLTSGASQATPRASVENQRNAEDRTQSNSDEDNAPIAGLLRTIQKPLSTINKIFSDEPDEPGDRPSESGTASAATPRLNPSLHQPPRSSGESRRGEERLNNATQRELARTLDSHHSSARRASAEEAEARRIQHAEHNNVVETLSNMFPNLDRDVIDDVVKMKEGR